MKYIFFSISLIIILFLFLSCEQYPECRTLTNGKARLVAYEVSENSRVWIENIETKQIQEFGDLGEKQAPVLNLGDTISIFYCKETGLIQFRPNKHMDTPEDLSKRFVTVGGYYDKLRPE